MIEWSDVDLAVRDAVREFVDKEVRPHVDALESGDMEPYPIVRKLFATFGIAEMARESLTKRLARMRDGSRRRTRVGVEVVRHVRRRRLGRDGLRADQRTVPGQHGTGDRHGCQPGPDRADDRIARARWPSRSGGCRTW